MAPDDLALLIARLDFAWITSLHIIYPPITIGLAMLLFFSEWRWLATDDDKWYRLCRFFERLFVVNFGAGVATGVTMEMAFGILYGPFSQAAGPLFGQILGYETITAFMYEAGFIGLMIFGWGKISRRMHLFATFNVAVSSSLSAMWILDANSWMQSPGGVEYIDGVFHVVSWREALLNPDVFGAFPHMLIACVEIALVFVAAVSAWFLLKNRHVDLFHKPLKYAMIALVFIAPLQVYLGDTIGLITAKQQPAALAAMEGHYDTYNPDGTPNTDWKVIGWPNEENDGFAWSISIPHVLSLLETHTWNSPVQGLNDFPEDERPPVVIPFYSFRVMVAIGGALMLLALWGGYLALRGRLAFYYIRDQKWFLRATLAAVVLPYIAIWTGWWTREVSRQPWIVYGMMRVEEGVSQMSLHAAIFWLVGFVIFELAVLAGTIYFLAKVCRIGPDLDSPIPPDTRQRLGHMEDDDDASPEYIRPV